MSLKAIKALVRNASSKRVNWYIKKKKKSKLQSIRNFGSLMRSELERCGLVMLLGLQEHNET